MIDGFQNLSILDNIRKNDQKTIRDIPNETILQIITFINKSDIGNLYKTTKYFNKFIKNYRLDIIKQLYNKLCIGKIPIENVKDIETVYEFYHNLNITFHLYTDFGPNCKSVCEYKYITEETNNVDMATLVDRYDINKYFSNLAIYNKMDPIDKYYTAFFMSHALDKFLDIYIKENKHELSFIYNCKNENNEDHWSCLSCLYKKCDMIISLIRIIQNYNNNTKNLEVIMCAFNNMKIFSDLK